MRSLHSVLFFVLAAALVLSSAANAQVSSRANRNLEKLNLDSTGNLGVNTTPAGPTSAPCKTVEVNNSGTAGADVAVAGTAVQVLAAATDRCGAVIENSGAGPMRCAPSGLTPTSTVGFLIGVNQSFILGEEGQQAWSCIRTTATSTSASVAEAAP
jgi:hypothetical protein